MGANSLWWVLIAIQPLECPIPLSPPLLSWIRITFPLLFTPFTFRRLLWFPFDPFPPQEVSSLTQVITSVLLFLLPISLTVLIIMTLIYICHSRFLDTNIASLAPTTLCEQVTNSFRFPERYEQERGGVGGINPFGQTDHSMATVFRCAPGYRIYLCFTSLFIKTFAKVCLVIFIPERNVPI